MEKYPNTYKLLKLLAQDNGLSMKKNIRWPEVDINMNLVEEGAKRCIDLGTEVMNDFVIGDDDKIVELAEKHNLRYLDDFLRNAFEGLYYYHFFSTN